MFARKFAAALSACVMLSFPITAALHRRRYRSLLAPVIGSMAQISAVGNIQVINQSTL
jgi:hypothetical protein